MPRLPEKGARIVFLAMAARMVSTWDWLWAVAGYGHVVVGLGDDPVLDELLGPLLVGAGEGHLGDGPGKLGLFGTGILLHQQVTLS